MIPRPDVLRLLESRARLSLLLLAVATVSCGMPDPVGDVIRVDGSSTVFPISEAVAEEFQLENRGTRVTVGISGTGGGFQKFCRGEADVANASRPIRQVEIDACEKTGISFIELPVAYDGIAVVVNPKNTWATSMTVDELERLWSPEAQGQVTRWSAIRPGWPEQEIRLFGPGVDSGTFDYFTDAVMAEAGASRGDFTSSEDDNVLVQGIATDELALGYFGFAYFEENQDKLKIVPIDDEDASNGDGPVAPSVETIREGTYQPLSRPVFIYVNQQALERPEVRAFVDFHLVVGPELVREVGYVPLTDREYELVRARLTNGTTGTVFTEDMGSGRGVEDLLGDAGGAR